LDVLVIHAQNVVSEPLSSIWSKYNRFPHSAPSIRWIAAAGKAIKFRCFSMTRTKSSFSNFIHLLVKTQLSSKFGTSYKVDSSSKQSDKAWMF
jgi:hypothetical protein